MSTKWRIYDEYTVACRLDRAELPGFFRKRATMGPGEAAVIIRGGRIEQVITEQSRVVSGFWDQLWAAVGLASDLEVLFVDVSPISVSVFFGQREGLQAGREGVVVDGPGVARTDQRADASSIVIVALSRDGEVITGECRVQFRIGLEEAAKLNGLLKGQRAIGRPDLEVLVREELLGPVLPEIIAGHDAEEFRGSEVIRRRVEETALERLVPSFAKWGLALEKLGIAWGLTEKEQQDLARRRAQRTEEDRDFEHRRGLGEMQRDMEIQRARMLNLQELKVAEAQGNEELKNLLLNGEIGRAGLVDGQRLNVAKVDFEIQALQVDLQKRQLEVDKLQRDIAFEDEKRRKELEARIEADKENRENKNLMEQFDLVQRKKLERERAEREAQMEQMKLQTGSTERILGQAIDKGVADPETLKEMLRQQTLQKALDRDPSKLASLSSATASEHRMDAYKEGQDRERQQQGTAAGAAANLLRAAGGGGGAFGAAAAVCPGCAEPVQPGWKACPKCGTRLGKPVCRGCGAEIPAIAKFCPHCGQAVAK